MASLASSKARKIGNTVVPAIGFGAMRLAAINLGLEDADEERMKFLDEVYARGCTHWDTADVYMLSEETIGKWFKKTGKRNDIFLATKFGITMSPERFVNGEPEYVKACMEKSLSKLGVDSVDLYYLHRPDPKTPIEVTVGAMAELVKAGKTKYIGLSECSASTIRRAHAVHPIAAIQVEYSLFTLDIESPETDILRTARELGIAIVAYSPLGRGLLTGQYKSPDDLDDRDFRKSQPRFSKENFPKILAAADAVAAIGKVHGATSGQIALAWLLAQGEDIIPIPGATKSRYLDENLGALGVSLSSEEVAELRQLAESVDIGSRYDANLMTTVLVDTPPLN